MGKDDGAELREALEGMVWQFGYKGVKNGRRIIHTAGLSALEYAFDALGWPDDPHDVHDTSTGCDYNNCGKWTEIGTPTEIGYKHFCTWEHEESFKNELLQSRRRGEE